MWLILCDPNDESAHWAYEQFKRRGYGPVELVLDNQLVDFSTSWEHRLGRNGVQANFRLADGRQFHNQELRGVLNRILFVPQDNLSLMKVEDRPYVQEELNAFFMSWLYSFSGSVLNVCTPYGLSGRHRHISEWVWLAQQAGLPVSTYQQSSQGAVQGTFTHPRLPQPQGALVRNLIAIDGVVVDDAIPSNIQKGCFHLASLCQTRLLGIDFFVDYQQQWSFAGATTYPRFHIAGERLVDQLARALQMI
ncbi:MAG: hypothetical protein AAF990_20240 [Bacteroidota bacterium]